MDTTNRYQALLQKIFFDRYTEGAKDLAFDREDLVAAAKALKIDLPKNLGDVIYSMRYRTPLPQRILNTQPNGLEWIIDGAGRAKYAFRLSRISRIVPNEALVTIKIPDATPELIAAHALSDEQALLAKVRYNRLIDIFLGLTTYSLQSHLRTTVKGVGQIEIDELYVGIDSRGRQYVIPVQAKGGSDRLSAVQTRQDLTCCAERFPSLICRAISAQFVEVNQIALFELTEERSEIKVVDEKHYRLVPADAISPQELQHYNQRSN